MYARGSPVPGLIHEAHMLRIIRLVSHCVVKIHQKIIYDLSYYELVY